MIIIIILAWLLFLILAWENTFLAARLTLLLLPTYLIRLAIFQFPINFLSGLIWILFIVWLIKSITQKQITFSIFHRLNNAQTIWPKPLKLPVILFLLAAIISLFIAPSLLGSIGIFKAYIIESLLLISVLISLIKTKADWLKLLTPLGWLIIIMGILGIAQRLTGWFVPVNYLPPNDFRTTLFFGYPNAGPLFIAPLLPIFLGLFWHNLKEQSFNKQFFFYLATIALGIIAIILAKSDGAIIGLLVGLIIFFLLAGKKTAIITGIIIVLGVVSFFFIIPANFQSLITNNLLFKNWSGQVRLYQWQETLGMLKDHPVLGVGLDNYQTAFTPYQKTTGIEIFKYPHNIFLNFWSELGLLGLISVLWLIISFFKTTLLSIFNNPNRLIYLGLLAGFITLLIHGLVDVPFFKNDLAVLWWLIIISPFILNRKS
ncbi:MAG: O-antigen ligase family protein [Candidatus Komeilibacteria bacterium]|nr:O-antigen ligase family protein [Candidatus Komeilibacteria bacterium]